MVDGMNCTNMPKTNFWEYTVGERKEREPILKLTVQVGTKSNPRPPADVSDSDTQHLFISLSFVTPFVSKMILTPIVNSRDSLYCSNGGLDSPCSLHKSWFLPRPLSQEIHRKTVITGNSSHCLFLQPYRELWAKYFMRINRPVRELPRSSSRHGTWSWEGFEDLPVRGRIRIQTWAVPDLGRKAAVQLRGATASSRSRERHTHLPRRGWWFPASRLEGSPCLCNAPVRARCLQSCQRTTSHTARSHRSDSTRGFPAGHTWHTSNHWKVSESS